MKELSLPRHMKTIHLTYRFAMMPSQEQQELLAQAFWMCTMGVQSFPAATY